MSSQAWDPYDETPAVLGLVPLEGRGSLPFALVHGESLVAAASWALSSAGITLFDLSVPFEQVRETGLALVVHDPLCPLTPASFLVECVAQAQETGAVVVGVRPVTDTVKEHADDGSGTLRLGATVDREALVCPTSPVVLPAAVVASLDSLETDDLADLVASLAQRFPVRHLVAPALGRRVVDESDLGVLAALSAATSGAPQPEAAEAFPGPDDLSRDDD